ncbi:MAG: type II toxin-antitoxin system prevent-host-death family antitoxin [Thermoanaerobacteraceae bacterium]|nr:type II toxin-antitoxin system prevent-host-death family antitoxin [Thermoanaerobacteraceae bacterium]
MPDINFVSTRELKNKTNEILRATETGNLIVVTRYGKPVATIKPFQESDLTGDKSSSSLYQKIRRQIGQKHPQLLAMTKEELRQLNDKISGKVKEFPSWQEMDRAAKGDFYGFSR